MPRCATKAVALCRRLEPLVADRREGPLYWLPARRAKVAELARGIGPAGVQLTFR